MIDAAKAPPWSDGGAWDYHGQQAMPAVTQAVPLIAVPTTANTGTEVSAAAVLLCGPRPGTAQNLRSALCPAWLWSIELTVGSPPLLTAASAGAGHAIEACISRRVLISSTLGPGRGLIVSNLRRAVENPLDSGREAA